MTTNTIAAIEAQLRNTITNSGTVLVRLNDEVLAQMNDIVAYVKTACNYDESTLDAEQLDLAMDLAMNFSNDQIGTKFADGYLLLEPQKVIDDLKADTILAERMASAPSGFFLPVVLVNKILNEVKYFAV